MRFSFLTIIMIFISLDVMAKNPSKEICLKQGQSPTGSSIGRDKIPGNDCCPGLITIVPQSACGKAFGGYAAICAPCGNGKCDNEIENNCNCPKDCELTKQK
jgi:hypothetical protein